MFVEVVQHPPKGALVESLSVGAFVLHEIAVVDLVEVVAEK